MSNDYQVAELLGEYENRFINMVVETYNMLEDLDKVKNDEEFWNVFEVIEAAYLEFNSAKKNYFELLTKDGGSVEGCSLIHEFENGMQCLDEKYYAIEDTVKEISDFRSLTMA
jgi:hypothetical protein